MMKQRAKRTNCGCGAKKAKANPTREAFKRDYIRFTPFLTGDTPEDRLKYEYTKQKIAEINDSVRARNEQAKKRNKLLRPYWANFYTGEDFQNMCVLPDLCEIDQLGYMPESIENNDHPLLSKCWDGGTLALGAMAASDEQYLEWSFQRIESYFDDEMNTGSPKAANELNSKQVTILELEEQLASLQLALAEDRNNYRHIAEAISFGASLMRLAMENPESPFAKWVLLSERNKRNAQLGGKARATCTDEQIKFAFTEYKKRNGKHSYAAAELNVADRLGYSNPRKLGERVKRMAGMPPAKWYKTTL